LNPFAFPSDTDFRFGLLVATVIGASLFFFNALYWSVPGFSEAGLAGYRGCLPALEQSQAALVDALGGAGADPAGAVDAAAEFRRCLAPVNLRPTSWTVGGTLLALLLAGGLYWLAPLWVIRRRRLVPLPVGLADLDAVLAELCREAELAKPPTFLWDPLDGRPTGLAFGRRGRYHVGLTGGLVAQLYQNPAAFRAVVRHELAHLRNADVDKTYFAVAVALAFALTAALPYGLVVALGPPGWSHLLDLAWRGLAVALLVYATLAAVLRAREVYADVRASLWDGPAGGLGAILAALPEPPAAGWRAGLAFHPSPAARRRALESTDHLLRLGFWEALGAGIAAALALPNVLALLSFVSAGPQQLLTGLALAPLVGGVVGLGVWRSVFAALARRRPLPSNADLALGLTAGVALGRVLSFDTTIAPLPARDAGLFAFDLFSLALLAGGLFLLLRWIADGALAWLASGAAGRSLRRAYAISLAITGALLAVGLGQLLVLHSLVEASLAGGAGAGPAAVVGVVALFVGGYLLMATTSPLAVLGLISLWAFPLAAAWPRPGRVDRDGAWAYLDGGRSAIATAGPSPFRVGEALRRGLQAGLLFCVLLLALRLAVRLLVPASVGLSDGQRVGLYVAMIALGWLVQGFAAWWTSRRIEWLGVPHGLLAAFVTGCAAAFAILALNLLFGGSIDPQFVGQVAGMTLVGGALIAVPSALLGTATGRSRRRLVGLAAGAPT
jgi:hypothetical protein